jgi:hypothetical protein
VSRDGLAHDEHPQVIRAGDPAALGRPMERPGSPRMFCPN